MKTFKSFIQLDEVEKLKLRGADKLAPDNNVAESKMSDLDIQYQDWKKLSDRKFFQLYHISKDAWKLKYKSLFKSLQTEAESHQSKTTMKHIDKPNAAEKKAAKDIKPGIKGVRDRLAMLQAAKDRGALKKEDVDLLSNLYDQLDESNQEIFLNQLEEDAEVLLAFAKTITEE